jgi:hypothetical protein
MFSCPEVASGIHFSLFVETMDILEKDRGKHFDPPILDDFGRKSHSNYTTATPARRARICGKN